MNLKEHLLAIAVVLIWGFNFVVIRWGIEDVHPMTMTMLRFLLTAIPMVFFVKKPAFRAPDPDHRNRFYPIPYHKPQIAHQ